MSELFEVKKMEFDNKRVVVVGSEFNFWLNEEDDVYDELFGKRDDTPSLETKPPTEEY